MERFFHDDQAMTIRERCFHDDRACRCLFHLAAHVRVWQNGCRTVITSCLQFWLEVNVYLQHSKDPSSHRVSYKFLFETTTHDSEMTLDTQIGSTPKENQQPAKNIAKRQKPSKPKSYRNHFDERQASFLLNRD